MIWPDIDTVKQKLINRETILYGIVGIGTSILNIALFHVLVKNGIEYKLANIITLIVVKSAAYILNKNIVFHSHADTFAGLIKEIGRFIIARGAAMLIDYFGLIILVEYIHVAKLPGKCFVTVLVIVLNYVAGKKHVFKDVKEPNTWPVNRPR